MVRNVWKDAETLTSCKRKRKLGIAQRKIEKGQNMQRKKTSDMVYVGIFAALIVLCSWISIPGPVPFTLQTLGVFLTVGLLGGRLGSQAVLVYILMGAIGLPVFAHFQGGLGTLLGTTGGYILGFLFSALLMWGMERAFGRSQGVLVLSMLLGLLACYAFGTVWFMRVYLRTTGAVSWMTVLGWCVFPFVVPDAIKIGLAVWLTGRLKQFVRA